MLLTHINKPITDGTTRADSSPSEDASIPSPMQMGSTRRAAWTVWVSGNAVKTREEVIVD